MRHDSASVIGTDNCVGLPVSDAAFCSNNGRSLIDVDAVRNQPTPRILALPLVVFLAAVTQMKIQLTPVLLVFPHMLIDALVTDTSDAILRQTAAKGRNRQVDYHDIKHSHDTCHGVINLSQAPIVEDQKLDTGEALEEAYTTQVRRA